MKLSARTAGTALALALVTACGTDSDREETREEPTPPNSTTQSPAPEPKPEPEPEPELVSMPDVVGMHHDEATQAVTEVGLVDNVVMNVSDPWGPDNGSQGENVEIYATAPAAGEEILEGEDVTLCATNENAPVFHTPDEVACHGFTPPWDRPENKFELNVQMEFDAGTWVVATFDIDDLMHPDLTIPNAQEDTIWAVEYVLEEHPDVQLITVEGYFPAVDEYGNETDAQAIFVTYTRDTIDQINLDNPSAVDIWEIRDEGHVHQQFQQ